MNNSQFSRVGTVRDKIIISNNELLLHHSIVVKQESLEQDATKKHVTYNS